MQKANCNCKITTKTIKNITRKRHSDRESLNDNKKCHCSLKKIKKKRFCKKCYYNTTNPAHLKRHKQIHNQKNTKKLKLSKLLQNLKCDLCYKKFSNSWNLKRHKKNVHELKNDISQKDCFKFICTHSECDGKPFHSKFNLQRHTINKHSLKI